MSKNSKKKSLFSWHFPYYTLSKRKMSRTIPFDHSSPENTAESIFEDMYSEDGARVKSLSGAIIKSLKRNSLFSDEMIEDDRILSSDTVLLWFNAANEYREQLDSLSNEEIDQEFKKVRSIIQNEEAMVDEEEFFNHHDADADFDYWLEMACWKPEEAVALSMGKDPRVVNSETLSTELEERTTDNAFVSESVFFREYLKRCEQVARAQEIDVLPKNITPSAFIKWATAQKMRLDDGLNIRTKELLARPIQTDDDEDGLSTKSQNAIYRILCGLAVCYYDHPHDLALEEKSKTYKRMADDLAEAGIIITDRTIKKHLKAASEYTRSQEVKIKVPKRLWRSREA